ncbi:MAG: hypothetical protein IPO53_05290 [Chitinophagaceae bacterium]|nr:hypothetical protein [Chitinophagaceae bacterium]
MALTVTIPAGQINAEIPINVSNTTSLDPNKTYGIGITITAVDGGYTIANNLKNLIVNFSIKNKYHGVYDATGYVYHPSVPRALSEVKDVLTSGANSVDVYLGDLGTAGYIGRFTVDPVTNNLTIVAAPGASGGPYTQFNAGLPLCTLWICRWHRLESNGRTYYEAIIIFISITGKGLFLNSPFLFPSGRH